MKKKWKGRTNFLQGTQKFMLVLCEGYTFARDLSTPVKTGRIMK